jgi:hypothetical protein
MTYSEAAYWEDLQGRLRGLLIMVGDQLSETTVAIVSEMIDAAECGIALDVMSEMLVESHASLDKQILANISDIAAIMKLDAETVERLHPLVQD